MKKGIHPEAYRTVVFKDISCDESFLTKSCAASGIKNLLPFLSDNPLVKVEISSMSHPFFTGKMKFVDTAGRIDKFNTRFAKYAKKMEKPGLEDESDNT